MTSSDSGLVQRPSLALLGVEPFRAAIEFANNHRLKANPSRRGVVHHAVFFPGLAVDGVSVTPLRQRGRWPGYEAFDRGQDRLCQTSGTWRHYVKTH